MAIVPFSGKISRYKPNKPQGGESLGLSREQQSASRTSLQGKYMSNTKKRNDEKRKSPAKLAGQSSRTKGSYPALLGIESASVRSV
ncbi:hypothetical protein BBM43_00325 [Vibrio parahaemolyticus]|nr:hypothetical protein BBM43_00325 [Vibrio parahaemolyticus]